MANKPAERKQAIKESVNKKYGKIATVGNILAGRMNIYVNGVFRAKLNDIEAQAYADNEMRKHNDVVMTRKQYDMQDYLPGIR